MSSSSKLKSLIQQFGWNEIINDLVWLHQLENDKPIDSLPIVPMSHLFKSELDQNFHQIKELCPSVDWTRNIVNHKTQYPIESSGRFSEFYLNNMDILISGHSSTTGNLVQLKVEKWETISSEGFRYNITYFFGKYYNEEYIEQTFKTLDEVVKFIDTTDLPVSSYSETL